MRDVIRPRVVLVVFAVAMTVAIALLWYQTMRSSVRDAAIFLRGDEGVALSGIQVTAPHSNRVEVDRTAFTFAAGGTALVHFSNYSLRDSAGRYLFSATVSTAGRAQSTSCTIEVPAGTCTATARVGPAGDFKCGRCLSTN
jgi:hypothetical protein